MWHNLPKVLGMYKNTLGVELRVQPDVVFKAIPVRHDIVHRNGHTKDDELVELTKQNVLELVDAMLEFVEDINKQLPDSDA